MSFDFAMHDGELDSIKEYFDFVETKLDKKIQGIEEQSDSLLDNVDLSPGTEDIEVEGLLESRNKIKKNVENHMQRFRSSMVALIYSYIEFGLNKLSKDYRSHLVLKLKLNDFNGTAMDRFSNFMIYARDFDLKEKNKKLWDEIICQGRIRNKIVHSFCELEEKDKNEREYIRKNDNLKIIDDVIFIEKEYVYQCISLAKKVFREIEKIDSTIAEEPR